MKYIYLPREQYIAAWVYGGEIPIHTARKYRSHERAGSMTLDECNAQRGSGVTGNETEIMRSVIHGDVGGIHARTTKLPGGIVPENVHLEYERWDGLILCLCNVESEHICRKLKYVACIAIEDEAGLCSHIGRQLGTEGEIRDCGYTEGPERGVFVKSVADAWQQEHRMYWPDDREQASFDILPGIARLMWVLGD